ncbi:TetR/AcrR family transcriptional regulator [Paracoccus homiensis]|uniref:DNA-binding transcriptional regulator, AcrR family n=1 Tax=Paracoccus homiensis TaxID=364199 RepID=A0A1I0ELA2_9RHOB|nr:TetR/AcrR family transcriptional regulator [Paracoccus homiensis]SET45963.1 DNA-binding transcriptional regulator, AcrR family [Paracoccus homiensis]
MSNSKKQNKVIEGRKFIQVCNGAKEIFLRDGYAGASVDDIARQAGVSKATLYAYFPDKTLMFQEVLRSEIESRKEGPLQKVSGDEPAAVALPRIGGLIAAWLARDAELRIYRLTVGEATRFPNIATAYHASLTKLLIAPLAQLLKHFHQRGEIQVADADRAARYFVRLCGSASVEDALLAVRKPEADAVRANGEEAGKLFLSAFGPSRQTSAVA